MVEFVCVLWGGVAGGYQERTKLKDIVEFMF